MKKENKTYVCPCSVVVSLRVNQTVLTGSNAANTQDFTEAEFSGADEWE